jgi:hypothetical protein
MPDFTRLRQLATAGRAASADLDRRVAELEAQSRAERTRLTEAIAAGNAAEAQTVRARIGHLAADRKRLADAKTEVREELAGAVAALLGRDVDLEGGTPLVLLPVRIEVRSTAAQTALRVRIFPDTLHAESLDEGVDEREREAAIAYWKEVWTSDDTQAPWPRLVSVVGSRRAPWVAQALRPMNLDERPVADADFPDPPSRGSKVASVRTLPDRFYVRVEQDGAPPLTVHGAPIPDELPVGLRDESSLVALDLDGFDLPLVDESLKWLIDYAEAERQGMAVMVQLPIPARNVRKLVVYGVRAALAPAEGAARLERLIRSHRFTDGAEFVAQGTPTNNTDTARTGWSRRTPSGPPDIAAAAAPSFASNASVVATALGIDPLQVTPLPGARDEEQGRAAAFNTALWTTTWKEAVEHISQAGRNNGDKRLDSPTLDKVREHWIDNVRGRGPLPAIRLGRQPYGLLPLVATDASWQPVLGGFVEENLVPFIHRSVRPYWNAAQSSVATIANRPLDDALREILGTDAVLRSLRVRPALTPEMTFETASALVLPDLGQHSSQQQVTKTVNLVSGVEWGEVGDNDLLGKNTRTLALPLVDETDQAYIANLLAAAPQARSPASVLQVLLEHAIEVERHEREKLFDPAHAGLIREAVDATRVQLDRGLVAGAFEAVQAKAFDDRRVQAAAVSITKAVGRLDARVLADRHPIPVLAPATTLQQVVGDAPISTRLAGEMGLQFIGEIFHAANWSARLRSAVETIGAIDDMEERKLLLSETLDCCSHRLDAWLTAAAAQRLRGLRQRGAAGAFIGAYGWLENIELRTPAPAGQVDGKDVLHDGTDGGFIHAPGLNQAATAAVLRSGRLTHRRGDPNSEALDIDLSSGRVRDALSLLQGMRGGQTLGALLGYRLERRLHERSVGGLELDRFIYVLRTLAPLRAGKLTAPGEAVEESLAARDVVDGLRLMEVEWNVILAKLVSGPDDSRYIDHWVAPRPADAVAGRPSEADAVRAAIDELEQTHDAVADLLLAESVHQLVVGNPARAAAVMNVLGAGEAVPPEPEVVRTPQTGITVSHRLAILIADPPPAALLGWNPVAPRALAEPRLEAWAQEVLGDPTAIRIAADRLERLSDAGFAALDVIYDADGDTVTSSTLAARLRLKFAPLDKDLPLLAPVWELGAMLRERLVGGRALEVADLGYPKSEEDPRRTPDAAEILARAQMAMQGLRAAATAGLISGLLPYGIRPSAPSPTLDLSDGEQSVALSAMLEQALGRVASAEQLLARAVPPPPPAPPLLPPPWEPPPAAVIVQLASRALAEVFGAGFAALAVLGGAPRIDSDPWAKATGGAAGVTARPGADIRPWLARAGVVRPMVSRYCETLLVREAQGRATRLRVIQTPVEAYGSWAGLPFPEGIPPREPLKSTVAEIVGGPGVDLSERLVGLVIDEWMEVVPKRLETGDPAKQTQLRDITTTGIAMNANAPGSRPPQAILVALSPDGAAWNGERLVRVLDEALALARMRCVTLDQLPMIGRYLPALYFADWSLQGEPVLNWVKVSSVFRPDAAARFLKVEP